MKSFYLSYLLASIIFSASCSSNNGSNGSASDPGGLKTDIAPDAVKDLKATAKIMSSGKWQATLTWTGSSSVKSFTIKRGVASGTYDDTYSNVTSPFTVSNLDAGTTQYFVIILTASVNGSDVSVTSAEFVLKIPLDNYTEKPGAFTVSAAPGDGQVSISWTEAERASFYIIQSGTSSGSYPTVVSKLATSPYVDKNLTNGQTRYYMVIAVNSVGSTNATSEASATPVATPGSFGAVTAIPGNGTITLNWASSVGATHYSIKRSTSASGPFSVIKDNNEAVTYIDTGLNNGTVYYYIVSALNSNNVSRDSSVVSATPGPIPGSFSLSNATPGNQQVTLTWGASSAATSYTIQYGTSSGSHPQTVTNSATSPYTVTGLTNGITYYFLIIAVNPSGSVNSNEISSEPNGHGGGDETHKWPGTREIGVNIHATLDINTNQNGLKTDSFGNFYVTGTLDTGRSYPHDRLFFIEKLNKDFKEVWTRVSDQPEADTQSYGINLTLDSNNNVYVLVEPSSKFYGEDIPSGDGCFIVKFDSEGEFQGKLQIGQGSTYCESIAADGNSIYITGETSDELTHPVIGYTDLFFAKINTSDLSLAWVQQIGYDSSELQGKQIAVDGNSLYIAGYVSGSFDANNTATGYSDTFIAKYDAMTGGSMSWVQLLGVDSSDMICSDLKIDNSNIYVAGEFDNYSGNNLALPGNTFSGNQAPYIAKYNSDGDRLWVRQFGPDQNSAYTPKIALDTSGNILAVGATSGPIDNNSQSGEEDVYVAKYNSSTGAKISISQFGVADGTSDAEPNGLVFYNDAFYVSGWTNGPLSGSLIGESDLFIAKLDSAGDIQIISQMNSSTSRYKDNDSYTSVLASTFDSSDNLYVTGLTGISQIGQGNLVGQVDVFVMKYVKGIRTWTLELGGGMENRADAIATYGTNVYIAGDASNSFDGTNVTNGGFFITKIDGTTGQKVITQIFDNIGSGPGSAVPQNMIFDQNGNLYIVGQVQTSSGHEIFGKSMIGYQSCFVTKFTESANTFTQQWTSVVGTDDGDTICKDLAISNSSLIVINQADAGGVRVKDANGDSAFADGDIYSDRNLTLVSYDIDAGTLNWAKNYGAPQGSDFYRTVVSSGLAVDSSGNIYVGGTYDNDGNADTLPMQAPGSYPGTNSISSFVAKFDGTGGLVWTYQLGSDDNNLVRDDFRHGLLAVSGTNLYFAGISPGSLYDPSTDSYTDYYSNEGDPFIAKIDTSGNGVWVRQQASEGQHYFNNAYLSLDSVGDIYLSGLIDQIIPNNGDGPGYSPNFGGLGGNAQFGVEDSFIVKYSADGDEQ